MSRVPSRGFTLVEVLVALMVVAIGLAALMTAVSSTARTSGYLRDKTLAQWIALNRLTEVRLTVNKLGASADTGQLEFANRTWHYDTRYFETSIGGMKRVVVRVWLGKAIPRAAPWRNPTVSWAPPLAPRVVPTSIGPRAPPPPPRRPARRQAERSRPPAREPLPAHPRLRPRWFRTPPEPPALTGTDRRRNEQARPSACARKNPRLHSG